MVNANTVHYIRVLEGYRDKCYVCNVLCQKSFEFYSKIKSFFSFPILLSSSLLTILNSGDFMNTTNMKISNITLNCCNVIFIAIITNFKIAEKQSNFKLLSGKYMKLCHVIEDILLYNISDITHNSINEVTREYDNLTELLEYPYPEHIKNKVKKMYKSKKILPNILNCDTDFSSTCHSPPLSVYQGNKNQTIDSHVSKIGFKTKIIRDKVNEKYTKNDSAENIKHKIIETPRLYTENGNTSPTKNVTYKNKFINNEICANEIIENEENKDIELKIPNIAISKSPYTFNRTCSDSTTTECVSTPTFVNNSISPILKNSKHREKIERMIPNEIVDTVTDSNKVVNV